MYQQAVYKIESRCCLLVSLTVIAVKLNSTASIILFRKDYLSQQWSFQVKEIHPQVSVSFIKCDRYSIGTSEKVGERIHGTVEWRNIRNTEWRKTLT